MRKSVSLWLGLFAALVGAPATAIPIGQVDDFQAGSLSSWSGGSTPVNVATGGPAGSGDRYLEIDSVNRNLGAYNSTQWVGDYPSAGITAIRVDVNNAGPDPVALRVTVFGPSLLTAFSSTNEIVLAPASGWIPVVFDLSEAALTRTTGTATYAQTLAAVSRLLLHNDPDPIGRPGDSNFVTATLGIDNVTAVPEPDAALLFATGLVAFAAARARTRN
jgi:hypothetical protein